jgi:hypothetical protein
MDEIPLFFYGMPWGVSWGLSGYAIRGRIGAKMTTVYTPEDEKRIADRIRAKQPGETDSDIARDLGIHERKVQYVRKDVVEVKYRQARNKVAMMPWR